MNSGTRKGEETAEEPLGRRLRRRDRKSLSPCPWGQKGSEQRQAVSWDPGLAHPCLALSRGFRRRSSCTALLRDEAVNNEVSDGSCVRCFHLSLRCSPVISLFVHLTAKVQQTGINQSACIPMSGGGNKGRVEIPTCH